MSYDFTGLCIVAENKEELYAYELFSKEIEKRTGILPGMGKNEDKPFVSLKSCGSDRLPHKDCFEIEQADNGLTIYAYGIRGFIFGYSYFLRKTEYKGNSITLIKNIKGKYIPEKQIRGHQMGYRDTPNTYDAWDPPQFFRYYLDIMAFGSNMCEHIPYERGYSDKNALMRFDEEELLIEASALADKVDMDVSVWFPNNSNETEEQALKRREELFKRIPRLDVVFPPGGDPGELYADEFVDRCLKISRILKKIHPNAKMYPSAQKPHEYPDWGYAFIEEIEKLPDEIDGVIMGPNHAFPLHELRQRLPNKYPLRFYPDITHNVRCEYPVHYLLDDWHFATGSCLGRESVNPRPVEFRTLHRQTRKYVTGGVSYSEGVHDDINKALWGDMDFFGETDLRTSLADYARFFFYGAPAPTIADGIFMLEQNWQGDPAENPTITLSFNLFDSLSKEYPFLNDNWRFNLCLFRAICDHLVRERRLFELSLLENARYLLKERQIDEAKAVLKTELSDNYKEQRQRLNTLAAVLFEQIGIQLDCENYHAQSPERGATLETIDLPVTDKEWYQNRLAYADTLPENERFDFIDRLLNRDKVEDDETYFSLALHGFEALGLRQEGELYINFLGDRPKSNNGTLPMSMLKLYDHHELKAKIGGFLKDTDYVLKITYNSKSKLTILKHHKITANGVTIYDGTPYGGEKDERFDKEMLSEGFESASYVLPKEVLKNGVLELSISEPNAGFQLCEFWITKKV